MFEDITRLPEYYPIRTERAILTARAGAIARISEAKTLVELGSGSSEKTVLLLDALLAHGTLGVVRPARRLGVGAGPTGRTSSRSP